MVARIEKKEKAVGRKSAKQATKASGRVAKDASIPAEAKAPQTSKIQESLDSPSEKVLAVPIDAHDATVTVATMRTEEEQDSTEEKKETESSEGRTEKNKKSEFALVAVLAFFVIFAIAMYFVVSDNKPVDPRIITTYDEKDPLLSNNRPAQYTYNNFEFAFVDGLWQTVVRNPRTGGDVNIQLHHATPDLHNISRSLNIGYFVRYMFLFQNAQNQSGVPYVLYAPDAKGVMGVAFLEVYNNLVQGMSLSAYPAFSNNNTDVKDVPILSCDDSEAPIIWLRHESPTQIIYREPNCLIVQGEDKELWKAENLLLYLFYSVVPGNQDNPATSPETIRALQNLERQAAQQQKAQQESSNVSINSGNGTLVTGNSTETRTNGTETSPPPSVTS